MNSQPLSLEMTRVVLLPMQESHTKELEEAAADPRIWSYYMNPPLTAGDINLFVEEALEERLSGKGLPFSVYDKQTNRIVGTTRLFDISPVHRQLEIGHTWYNPSVWRTQVNTECKYLLLRHSFETLETLRVQIKTDLRNERSQAAIARLGAQKEGILRKHRVLQDGYVRDTVMFSIIDAEWPHVKERLKGYMNQVRL